jgi:hypothetical protein
MRFSAASVANVDSSTNSLNFERALTLPGCASNPHNSRVESNVGRARGEFDRARATVRTTGQFGNAPRTADSRIV